MGKALKTVGMIVAGAALVATGAGALLMPGFAGATTLFGVSMSTLQTVSAGLSAVGAMLDKPKSQGSASPTEWTSNPDQPTPFAFGRVGAAGKIVHRDEYGPDNMYQGIVGILSGAGPVRGNFSFKGDDQAVTFGSGGIAVSSQWNGEMWMQYRLGNQPDTALTSPPGLKSSAALPGWTTAHKLSGKACYMQTLGENSKQSAYSGAEPTPLHEFDGIYGWDPRYDSTYPGGFGACRLNDRTTWRWIDDPNIAGLNWALGMKENGQVIGGVGASIDGVDVAAFVECANISETNGWKITAWPDTSEDASQVLKQMLEAGGAVYARHAGLISCVSRATLRTSIVTISAKDTAGPIELDTGSSSANRINTITPSFMSASDGWKIVPANPVGFASLITEDGGKKSKGLTYRFVPNVTHAAQLAAYDILDPREPFAGTIPLKPYMRLLKRGDCFTINEPGFLMDGVKCIVLGRPDYDTKTGIARVSFRSETDGKHALALGKTTTMPAYPSLTPFDPTVITPPAPGEWTLAAEDFVDNGASVPALVFTGDVDNALADAVVFEFRPVGASAWAGAGIEGPNVERKEVTGLTPGTAYEGAVSYRIRNNVSARLELGPVTAGILSTGPGAGARTPIGRSVDFPFSSTATTIIVAAHDIYMASGETFSIPGTTITGLTASTLYGVFWKPGAGFEVEVDPSTTHLTTGSWILLWQQYTSDTYGDFPDRPPAPGGSCPHEDEPILLAIEDHTGPGETVRAGDVEPGMWVWTRHESTSCWGAFEVEGVTTDTSPLLALVMRDGRRPRFSPDHRMGLASGKFKRLGLLTEGVALDGTRAGSVLSVEDAGEGMVVKISVRDARTFVIDGLLSHNVKMDQYEVAV